ncbi:alpha/beta-hydrolase, partial [Paxillus ammoniavirescens]
MTHTTLLLLLAGSLASASASPLWERSSPTVTLDSATVTGISSGSVNEFLGIPFAQPPLSATAYGLACPQQAMQVPTVSGLPTETLDYLAAINKTFAAPPSGEDCLTLNVIAPADYAPDSKLPVV